MNEAAKPPPRGPIGALSTYLKSLGTNFLKKIFRFRIENLTELKQQIALLHAHGHLNNDTLDMLDGAMSISKMQVRDIMVPKPSMKYIRADTSLKDILKTTKTNLHSRYPVIDDNEKPIGILFAKDLISNIIKIQKDDIKVNERPWNAQLLMRQANTVPENMNLSVLLRSFRSGKNHLAISINEYGEIVGLITIEDVLEQIVGDIKDEHDTNEEAWILDHENHSTVKAKTPIDTFNKHFNTNLTAESGESIASVIIEKAETLPKQGEKIEIGEYTIRILKADNRRLHLISVIKPDTRNSSKAT